MNPLEISLVQQLAEAHLEIDELKEKLALSEASRNAALNMMSNTILGGVDLKQVYIPQWKSNKFGVQETKKWKRSHSSE